MPNENADDTGSIVSNAAAIPASDAAPDGATPPKDTASAIRIATLSDLADNYIAKSRRAFDNVGVSDAEAEAQDAACDVEPEGAAHV